MSVQNVQSKSDMADMLERFFELALPAQHTTGWEWDDFEHEPFSDPALEAWRQRVLREVGHLVAPTETEYDRKIAHDRILGIIASLRKDENA
jgi:hypothetical protein